MVLWNFDLLWKTMVLWEKKLWYYGQNYGTMDKTMDYTENYKKKEEKMHIRLPNTKKL